ncbi:histidine phosphatase family protein [Amycolatopsis nigrescens]|uniref:histidine phosphatase family protein n=1 Tax=Amycolatopsis nigrescens TaxID=381445 RepID=UPI00037E4613|nr:histidine phosphatase family protein [Amycolatopsis nigrescens]
MRLYLIRHAESTANVRKALDTALPGPPLTDLGREQAEALAESVGDQPIVAVYASHAIRAQQTAAPLAMKLGFETQLVEGVQEVSVGDLEGRTDREAIEIYASVVHPWTRGDLAVEMPGGETGEQVRSRYVGAVEQLRAKHEQADPDGIVALVSHGGAIRLGSEWLSDNVRPEIADEGLIPNTGMVVLETRPDGGWHCLSWCGVPM